jgi:hypothetical protein
MFIAIDPGKRVGVATFRADGSDISKKIFLLDDEVMGFRHFMGTILESFKESAAHVTFIVESFHLRMDKALEQTGADMPAARAIGVVEMVDTLLASKSNIVMVPPRDLYTALKWAGHNKWARAGAHPPDDIAAYSHGVKYLIDKGLRKHPIFDKG